MAQDTVRIARARHLCRTGRARLLRKAASVSLSELAADVNVSTAAIAGWEQAKFLPRGQHAVRLCLALLETRSRDPADEPSRTHGVLAGGRATVTFDEAYPALHTVSRASFYRMAAAGQLPGVLALGRKRLLSLPVYLEFLGVPRETIWAEAETYKCALPQGDRVSTQEPSLLYAAGVDADCETCRFWRRPYRHVQDQNTGECRRHAPREASTWPSTTPMTGAASIPQCVVRAPVCTTRTPSASSSSCR